MTLAAPLSLGETPALADSKTIPFDYAFRFELTGEPGKTLSRTIVISAEGPFTAVSIGYGAISQVQPIRFGPNPADFQPNEIFALVAMPATIADIRLGELAASLDRLAPTERDVVLSTGFRLNPDIRRFAITAALPANTLSQAFEAIGAPPDLIKFTYALIDEGSGREFQSQPILNTAGLGSANGERPFRHLARPITFAPLATIRMDITEIATVPGELHVSLHGYKALGGAPGRASERELRRPPRRPRRRP